MLESIDRGSYTDSGFFFPSPSGGSTLTGTINDGGVRRRGFFVFDLGSVLSSQPQIASATFTANVFAVGPGAFQPDIFNTVSLYDYTGSIETLRAGAFPVGNPTGVATFNDLGSGVIYSTQEISFRDSNTPVSFTFNQNGISALNASRNGLFAFGVRTDREGFRNNFIFGNSNIAPSSSDFTLQVTPVPGPLPFLGLGAAFGFSRKLKKRMMSANSTLNSDPTA